MKWDKKKLELLLDNYAYMPEDELSTLIGCSAPALRKKASRLHIKKATNNMVIDGDQKYCTYCKTFHSIEDFYKDRHANGGYQYYCKRYYKSHNPRETTTPLKNKSHNPREGIDFQLDWKHNPTVIVEGKECIKCKVCGNTLELNNFYKNSNMINGRVNVCKTCYKNKKK
ncbi:hypothetical protein [Romboutsia sp.]|uniref:hypothetical protein n=1 Tax=Romboutsia sp. TaxID=1965302 RepID=UPI002B84AAE2|nr:hypothetical protein [Romboutsia sp.]HSQ87767.1 hypothetical protein [Romboutsia sp.]